MDVKLRNISLQEDGSTIFHIFLDGAEYSIPTKALISKPSGILSLLIAIRTEIDGWVAHYTVGELDSREQMEKDLVILRVLDQFKIALHEVPQECIDEFLSLSK